MDSLSIQVPGFKTPLKIAVFGSSGKCQAQSFYPHIVKFKFVCNTHNLAYNIWLHFLGDLVILMA